MTAAQPALRREQLRVLLTSVPVLLGAYFLIGRVGSFADRPLIVAMVLLPLFVVVIALGLPLAREGRVALGGGFLWFFVAYCLLFSIAAGTRVLEGKRTLVQGFESESPSNVLGLRGLGDWHYRVAPSAPPTNDLLVIELPSFQGASVDDARLTEMRLIALATDQKAKGIAFDLDLDGTSAVDRVLCFRAQAAEGVSVPVVFGYLVDAQSGAVVRRHLPPDIAACVPEARQGTLVGVKESDGLVRMVPTSHVGDTTRRSFSYRIARLLTPSRLSDVSFAQFVAPASPVPTIRGFPTESNAALLRDRFVIVGSDRKDDVHQTPFGLLSGVMIHALAAHSLRTNHLIRRLDVRWVMPAVFAMCYVLILLQAQGGLKPLLTGATLMAMAIVISAVVAMRVQLLWIDVSYPLLAVGALTVTLAAGARLQRARTLVPRAPSTSADEPTPARFDVFLSHNSADKPTVIALAEALRDRKLHVWLDAWELVPGQPWQVALEQVIETVPSAAVIVGSDGIGPWEEPEMRACIDQCVQRKLAVIPVLLPGAPDKPKLPLFLRSYTWVDLRAGLNTDALDRLEWGITGIKPRR